MSPAPHLPQHPPGATHSPGKGKSHFPPPRHSWKGAGEAVCECCRCAGAPWQHCSAAGRERTQ